MRSQKFIRYFEGAFEHSFAWVSLLLAGGSEGLKDSDERRKGRYARVFWAVVLGATSFLSFCLGPDAFVAAFGAISVGLAVVGLARTAEVLQQKAERIRDSLHDRDNFETSQLKRAVQQALINLELHELQSRQFCLRAIQACVFSLRRLPHVALSARLLPTPNLARA